MQFLVLFLELLELRVANNRLQHLVEVTLDRCKRRLVYRHLDVLLWIELRRFQRILRAVPVSTWISRILGSFRHNLGVEIYYVSLYW